MDINFIHQLNHEIMASIGKQPTWFWLQALISITHFDDTERKVVYCVPLAAQ